MLFARRRPASAFARAQHGGRSIDRDHAPRPARDFDGQVPLTAADVDDVERRQAGAPSARAHAAQLRPGYELPAVAGVGSGVLIEVFAAQAQHFLQSRLVRTDRRRSARAAANCDSSSGHSGPWPLSRTAGRQPVIT